MAVDSAKHRTGTPIFLWNSKAYDYTLTIDTAKSYLEPVLFWFLVKQYLLWNTLIVH